MKDWRIYVVGFVVLLLMFASAAQRAHAFNYDWFDTTYAFDRAIVRLPDGEIIAGAVDSWKDYENSDQIQVKIDGVTYLVHSNNVALIAE